MDLSRGFVLRVAIIPLNSSLIPLISLTCHHWFGIMVTCNNRRQLSSIYMIQPDYYRVNRYYTIVNICNGDGAGTLIGMVGPTHRVGDGMEISPGGCSAEWSGDQLHVAGAETTQWAPLTPGVARCGREG